MMSSSWRCFVLFSHLPFYVTYCLSASQLRMEALAAEAAASKRRADLLATENDALKRGDTAGAAAIISAAVNGPYGRWT